MNNKSWEIVEQEVIGAFNIKIWLISKDTHRPSIAKIVNGFIELEEIKEGQELKPTFEMPYDAWQALKKAMIDGGENTFVLNRSNFRLLFLAYEKTYIYQRKLKTWAKTNVYFVSYRLHQWHFFCFNFFF